MLGRVSHVWWIERRSETEEKCSLSLSLCCFIEWHKLLVFHLDTLAGCTKCSLAVPLVRLWLYNFYALLKKQEHFIYWKMLLVFCKLIASTCHHSTISFSISFLHLLPPVLPHLLPPPLTFAHPSFFFFLISPLLFSATIQTHFDISFPALLPLFGFPAFRLSPEVKRCTSLPKVISMLMSLLVR